jgi:hypothetical protein
VGLGPGRWRAGRADRPGLLCDAGAHLLAVSITHR